MLEYYITKTMSQQQLAMQSQQRALGLGRPDPLLSGEGVRQASIPRVPGMSYDGGVVLRDTKIGKQGSYVSRVDSARMKRGNWATDVPGQPDASYVPVRNLPKEYDGDGSLVDNQLMSVVSMDEIIGPSYSDSGLGQSDHYLSMRETLGAMIGKSAINKGVSVWGMKVMVALTTDYSKATPIRVQMLASDAASYTKQIDKKTGRGVQSGGKFFAQDDEKQRAQLDALDAVRMSQGALADDSVTAGGYAATKRANRLAALAAIDVDTTTEWAMSETVPSIGWNVLPDIASEPWQYLYDNIFNMNDGVHEFGIDDCYFKLGGAAQCDVTVGCSTPSSSINAMFNGRDTAVPVMGTFRISVQLLVSWAPVATRKYLVEYNGDKNAWAVNLAKTSPCTFAENMRQEAGMYWPIDWSIRVHNLLYLAAFPACAAIIQQGLAKKLINRGRIDGSFLTGGSGSGYAATIAGGEPALWLMGGGPHQGRRGFIQLNRGTGIMNAGAAKKGASKGHKRGAPTHR
jgi:hypothetical protein